MPPLWRVLRTQRSQSAPSALLHEAVLPELDYVMVREPMSPLHLLLSDNDVDSRFLLSLSLCERFPTCHLVDAATVSAAAALLTKIAFDAAVIVTTHEGVQEISRLRATQADLPIVVLSNDPFSESDLCRAGATRFVAPENWHTVVEIVADVTAPLA